MLERINSIKNIGRFYQFKPKNRLESCANFGKFSLIYAENGTELDVFIHREWEIYARTLAMERIKGHFSGKALEVFDRMLDNKPVAQIAEELELGSSSVYKMGDRVKNRLKEEIKQIRQELEF